MCSVLLLSVILTKSYRLFAINNSIIANPNERTLHEKPIPRGGGIVFSMLFVITISLLWISSDLSIENLMALAVGGFFAALFGFLMIYLIFIHL